MAARLGWSIVIGALCVAAGLTGVSCGVSDEIVAEKSLPESGASEGGSGKPCGPSLPDCLPEEFCSKTSCGATTGTCELRPTTCDNSIAPVCGCTGLSYWNRCLRMQHGESANGDPRSCQAQPIPCDSAADGGCPAGAYCVLFYPGCVTPTEPQAKTGFCLVLPDSCPIGGLTLPGFGNAVSCATNMCMDYCSAIQQRAPFYPVQGQCP
jgi:hypothetical protein